VQRFSPRPSGAADKLHTYPPEQDEILLGFIFILAVKTIRRKERDNLMQIRDKKAGKTKEEVLQAMNELTGWDSIGKGGSLPVKESKRDKK